MIADTSLDDRDFRSVLAAQFERVNQQIEKMGAQSNQTAIILDRLDARLSNVEAARKEEQTNARQTPRDVRDWISTAVAVVAILIALSSHLSVH